MIRKGTEADIRAVTRIYDHIHDEEEAGRTTTGWIRGVYPVEATAKAGLQRDDLFVYERDGEILAAAFINQQQVDVYERAPWQYAAEPGQVMVLHALVVDPAAGKHGIGREMAAFYESYAREQGCTVLRIDTNERNTAARSLYKKLGYREADIVPCVFNGIPDVHLVLLEKQC